MMDVIFVLFIVLGVNYLAWWLIKNDKI